MKNISIIKVKKEGKITKMYFSSIEEMHEMYVYLLKKNKKRKIKILKETKDKRVSSISGKYYSELQDITIGDYNILEISDRISLRCNDIQHYKDEYYYTSRKEFDNKKNGFSYISSEWEICYTDGITGLRRFQYDMITSQKVFDYGYFELSSLRFDILLNSVEDLHNIYLYFLKLGYHTKILMEDVNEYPIKRKKFKTTQKAIGDQSGELLVLTVMLDKKFSHFQKFIEDYENLYWKMNYTYRTWNIPNLSSICNRFPYWKTKKLIKTPNYGDCI